jgi:oligopeptide transport system ATP-binding protein
MLKGKEDRMLEVRDLKKHFSVTQGSFFRRKSGEIKAVDGVSFNVSKGETLGLVGESGCGKTTTGRCILQLQHPSSGKIIFEGKDICKIRRTELCSFRRKMQFIFQDPYSSLNPRMKVRGIVGEPLKIHKLFDGKALIERVYELLRIVGLNQSMADRYPHELSGGQRQRIGIARALAVNPEFIVFDEPISALDVSIQAQIINLLEDIQGQFNLTYIFIAHDLAVVRHISSRVAVMYLGKIVEIASRSDIYDNPLHPYTKALLSAVPIPDYALEAQRTHFLLQGEIPSPVNPPRGCAFHPRCRYCKDVCQLEQPVLKDVDPGHQAACHLY